MAGRSYDTTFEYEGKLNTLTVTEYWRTNEDWTYYLFINGFLNGTIKKIEGSWVFDFKPDPTEENKKNFLFELQGYDLQIIGEMIEENLS